VFFFAVTWNLEVIHASFAFAANPKARRRASQPLSDLDEEVSIPGPRSVLSLSRVKA